MTQPWLAVIDMQHIFGASDSAWAAPGFDGVIDPINQLVAAANGRVTFTRFVAPQKPTGAWVSYYRQWAFALQPDDAPLYQLDERIDHSGRKTMDANTFGKWTPELAADAEGELVLCGVSTDCCVLSTALAAADSGVHVQVVADACAGVNDVTHRQALDTMALYAPLIEIVSTAEVLTRWA
ncbi:cysteine hydrolase family protein [Nakamurella panacisegetis]|nr:cysteine hydrolase [Nakamurella panacisegetis]